MATAGPDVSALLPFRPLSFRDFMLYEKHVVDAGRGYTQRFLPTAYPIARLYEKLLGRPVPAFKPSALWYREPIYYMSNHLTFVPSGTPVRAPSYTQAFDYELEIGFVLKKPLFNATENEALEAIGAFVVLNDFSARDVQRAEMQSGFGPQKAKHFLSSMSAVAVTAVAAIAAAAAVATTRITAAGETAKNEGRRLVFTADEGDSNQREKHRDSQNNNSVHPRILQLTYRYRKRELLSCRHSTRPTAAADGSASRCDHSLAVAAPSAIRKIPCCEDLRIAKNVAMAKVRS